MGLRTKILGITGAILFVPVGAHCESDVQPSREARAGAAALGASHFGDRLPSLTRGVLLTFASDHELRPEFTSAGGHFSISPHSGDWSSGLASAISSDGYLLTAAHVVKRFNWIVGWMDGKLEMKAATVVAKRAYGPIGAEFAVLRVAASIGTPLTILRRPGVSGEIYILAPDRVGGAQIQCLAGAAIGYSEPIGGSECIILYTNLPTWNGDSGGPVLSSTGELIGVNVGWKKSGLSKDVRTVCCPNPTMVESIISKDRVTRTSPNQHLSTTEQAKSGDGEASGQR
jgi:hypothetical protein